MDQLILGIDVGTTNTKAILATPDGRVIAQDTQGLSLLTPRPGWVEQNPEEWWQATAQVTARLVRQVNVQRGQIAAIGVSAQGAAAVLVDEQGNALRPGIIWMDARSEAQCEEMRQRCGDRILAINGKLPAPY